VTVQPPCTLNTKASLNLTTQSKPEIFTKKKLVLEEKKYIGDFNARINLQLSKNLV